MSMLTFERVTFNPVLIRKQEPGLANAAPMTLEPSFRRSRVACGLSVLLLLAACDSSNDVPETTADVDGKLFCAVDGAKDMTQSCLLERVDSPEGQVLVVHHPEGGFRRFEVVRDGRGVVPADGAEPSKLFIVADNMIDVAVGGDRYRFPATIGPKAD